MPTKTVVTGTIQNVAGNLATSGTVKFELQPQANSIPYRVSGTTIIAPTTVVATINASGLLKAENGTDPLELWGTDTILPSQTFYRAKFFPDGEQAQTWNLLLITGSSYSLNSPVFYEPQNFVPDQSPPTFQAIQSNIIPAANGQYNLGSDQKKFGAAYIEQIFADTLNFDTLDIAGQFTNGQATTLVPYGDATLDTAQIQAALASYRDVLLLPPTFIHNGPLQIPNSTTLRGIHGKTVLQIASGAWTGAAFPLPPITNADTATGHDVTVRDLIFDGNIAGNPTAGAPGVMLSFRGTLTRWEVSGCTFKDYPGASVGPPIGGAPVGIGVSAGTNQISDGYFVNNQFTGGRGGAIVVFGPRNQILNNTMIGSTDAVFGAQGVLARGNRFSGNYVKDCPTTPFFSFYVEGASENIFSDNIMDHSSGIVISDFSLAKPQRNFCIGNQFLNAPAGAFPITFIQSGVGLGASDNVVIFNMGQTVSTDPAYSISGTIGQNLVILMDQGNGYIAFLDCVAKKQKWIGTDTFGGLGFLSDSKSLVMTITDTLVALENATPFAMEDSGGTRRSVLNMTSGNNLEIGQGMTTGVILLSAGGRPVRWGVANVALGGGAAPTLGTIGGGGPATAGQNSWLQLQDSTGATVWIPVWK